jgi:hypothetical protein
MPRSSPLAAVTSEGGGMAEWSMAVVLKTTVRPQGQVWDILSRDAGECDYSPPFSTYATSRFPAVKSSSSLTML